MTGIVVTPTTRDDAVDRFIIIVILNAGRIRLTLHLQENVEVILRVTRAELIGIEMRF